MIEKKDTYCIKEVMELLDVSRSKVYALVDEGKLDMSTELPRKVTVESVRKYYASLFPDPG